MMISYIQQCIIILQLLQLSIVIIAPSLSLSVSELIGCVYCVECGKHMSGEIGNSGICQPSGCGNVF